MGFEVTLGTVEPSDWNKIRQIFGDITKPDREVSLSPVKVRAFGIYMKLLSSYLVFKEKSKHDLTINTHGDVLMINCDINYMHFPTFCLSKHDVLKDPVNLKYSKSWFWKMYFKPYEFIQKRLVEKYGKIGLVLTNSKFSRDMIKKYVERDAIVVYPPVDIEKYLYEEGNDREDLVVACGRYSPEKFYEFILAVANLFKKEGKRIGFIIIGSVANHLSERYYNKLMWLKKKMHLDDVKLLGNVPLKEQIRIYRKAKVFIHAMRNEHFGMAVVEAMASGLIPVVHRSGGAWLDIVDEGKYGFGYHGIYECKDVIEKALDSADSLRRKVVFRAKVFSKRMFMRRMEYIVKRMMESC